ncbi:MAG: DNA-binding protein [Planctomycetes bacterium]|nr:DNA-binding protein [Planctomycetota bacterium]
MSTLFLAWQDPAKRLWYPIGRLTRDQDIFRFEYTMGAQEAKDNCGFELLRSFPDLHETYESVDLFPLFSSRTPNPSRPDYAQYLEWLNAPADADDPIALLARNGGRRVTDQFEVFPCPEPDAEGRYHIHFFAHGLHHFPTASIARVQRLQPSDRLLLAHDFQNPHDPYALLLRTADAFEGDRHLVGYCPRYLLPDTFEVLTTCAIPPEVRVERVNLPPAPLQLRLLCNLTACWPEGFTPCSGPMYQPIASSG